MNGRKSCETVKLYLPPRIRAALDRVSPNALDKLSEVRLRSRRGVSLVYPDRSLFLRNDGTLTRDPAENSVVSASPDDIKETVEALCRFSVHCCTKELREGYFVIENGIRVGAAGTVSDTPEKILKDISSLNFRIARSVIGCGEEIFRKTQGKSLIICGGVGSGKTTLLRDLCRLYGSTSKVCLIDERNEISASFGGCPQNDVGVMTDVIVGCERSWGITSAIRTLSPEIIICDELAEVSDTAAVLGGFGCGVRFIASVHAENYDDLLGREVSRPLMESGVFAYAAFLEGSSFPSKIRELRRLCNAS